MKDSSARQRLLQALSLVCLFCLLGGCAATMNAGSHCTVDPTSMNLHKTFSWHPEGAVDLIDESGYISPAIVELLKTRVVRELNFKGFRLVEPSATEAPVDLTIQLYLRARRELVTTNTYGAINAPCMHSGCTQAAHQAGVPIETRTTGFLAADAYLRGEAIWRGWVERLLYPSERDRAGVVIDQAVPVLFENFPP